MNLCPAFLFAQSIKGAAVIQGNFSPRGRTFEPSAALAAGLQRLKPLLSIRHVSR
jgi:hypothetical protein